MRRVFTRFVRDTAEAYLLYMARIAPPRAGVDAKALAALVQREPRQIVYISCDPSTLARDCKRLVDAGYTLREVQPVDMFPQTHHIEAVAHLTR